MNDNALDYQVTLVGNEKNTLLFETNPSTLSEILIKQECKVTKIVINQLIQIGKTINVRTKFI